MKATKSKSISSVLAVLFMTLFSASVAFAAAPVIFFSDLVDGPKVGWEGSATKGAAVTVWGLNFGSARGSNYLSCGSVTLTNDSDYVEWGATGTAKGIPRGLERITFYLNSGMKTGASTMSVTVSGFTSNTIPFYVRDTGKIYFIAAADGSDSYNGKYATRSGHSSSDGPWKSLKMALRNQNGVTNAGDVVYIRGGTAYTESNSQPMSDDCYMQWRGETGTANNGIGVIGYPGETPEINLTGISRGFSYQEKSPSYTVIAKLRITKGAYAIMEMGSYNRIIGNHFYQNNASTWNGLVRVGCAQYACIYGNLFQENGFDMYKHDIYIKAECGGSTDCAYTFVGWNEFRGYTLPGSGKRGGCIEIQSHSAQSSYETQTKYTYIHDNYFVDGMGEWVRIETPSHHTYLCNNIVYNWNENNSGSSFVLGMSGEDIVIYNNVFYWVGSANSALFSAPSGGPKSVTLRNNIMVPRSGQRLIESPSNGPWISQYDAHMGGAWTSTGNLTVSNKITLTSNPFRDVESEDFRLNDVAGGGASCKDAGTSIVSSAVEKDYLGVARPQGSAYDIGAFEFDLGEASSEPPDGTISAPKGLTIIKQQ